MKLWAFFSLILLDINQQDLDINKKISIVSVLSCRSPVKLPAVASSCLAVSHQNIFLFLSGSLLLQLFLICGSEPRAPKRVSATTDWYWVTAQLGREKVCCYIGALRDVKIGSLSSQAGGKL